MSPAAKRLGTDLAALLEKHGPRTLHGELTKLVEAQGAGGYVMCHALQALLDRYPKNPIASGYSPIQDRAHALRVLKDLALWKDIPADDEIDEAIDAAIDLRHPDTDTGTLQHYLRLIEVQEALKVHAVQEGAA
jgi:hypothetical protein